ncbi:MAG: LptF/LptG family permease [Fibrobacterales bacterium]
MRLITRYVSFNFLKVFFLLLVCTLVVALVMDFVGQIKMWLNDNHSPAEILEYYIYYTPQIMHLVMPVVVMLAVVASVGGMAKHFELTPIQFSGISTFRALVPIMVLAAIITGGMFYIQETILPNANHKRLEIAQTGVKKVKREMTKKELVYIGGKTLTISFKKYSAKDEVGKAPVICRFRHGKIYDRFDAEKMVWSGKYWVLKNGTRRLFLQDTVEHTEFKTFSLSAIIDEKPTDFINQRFSHEEMDMSQLKKRIATLKRVGESTKRFETQLHFKLSGPFMNFFVALMALSLTHRTRKAGIAFKFAIGLLIVVLYYVTIKAGLILGEQGAIAPVAAAWIGNVIFGILSITLFVRSVKV